MNRSIIIAAIIISGAILLNGYIDRASHSPHFSRPSESEVKASVVQSFEYAFQALEGENIVMDKKRDIQKIQVNAIRYSESDSRMLVDFTLLCADGDNITSGIGLNRDEFGVYRGVWDFGRKQAHFEIKNNG